MALKLKFVNPNPPAGYNYYTDLEKALRKMGVIDNELYDVAVFGLSWFNSPDGATVIRNVPHVGIVHKIEVDWEHKLQYLKTCDLVLSPVPKLPIKSKLFRYGVDPNIFNDKKMERIFDFGFTGALHSEPDRDQSVFPIPHFRKKIQELARTEKPASLYLTGSDDVSKCRIKSYEKYSEVLSQAKIWFASTGPNGDIGPRYYEVQASKTLLFCDPPPKEYQRYFRDGYNCVYITEENFIEKLRYYLANEDKRRRIVNRAFRQCMAQDVWAVRAWELIDLCTRLCGSRGTAARAKRR